MLPSQSRSAVSSLGRRTSSIHRPLYDILLALSSLLSPLCGSLSVHHTLFPRSLYAMAPFTYLAFTLALVCSVLAAPAPMSPEPLQKRITHSGRVCNNHNHAHLALTEAYWFDRARSSTLDSELVASSTWTATTLSPSRLQDLVAVATASRSVCGVLEISGTGSDVPLPGSLWRS